MQILCCFGSAACHLCCACLPSIKSSTSARIGYLGIIVVGIIISCIMLAPVVAEKLAEVTFLIFHLFLLGTPRSVGPGVKFSSVCG